ncbi:MAG: glycosyltransferase family 39 protein [Verrucomicrobiaceae bacterium]|nr:glycosyltransferase family 39 protein [Verrucomicrobiaceae bacterium]
MRSVWAGVALIVAAWAVIYLPGLNIREVQGEEARRVLPGRTMLQTGEWIVPRSAGRVYNRKPPMINWVSAAALSVSGRMDERTVRLPTTLAMLALALVVFGIGRVWMGELGALLAALMGLANVGMIEKGRLAEIDGLYVSLFGMALVVWLAFWWREKRLLAWVVSGVILGLGFLTKGPVHVWYFYAVVIGVLLAEGRAKQLLNWRHWAGLVVFVSVWAPWALLNSARNPAKDSGEVWAQQVTHRLGLMEFDVVNWLLQIPESLINFMPWSLLLPFLWMRSTVDRWADMGRKGQWLRGLRNGLVVGFLVIALLPSSRPRFMLPMNVLAAILSAEVLLMMTEERLKKWSGYWRVVMMVLTALLFVLAVISPVYLKGLGSWCALAASLGVVWMLWLWRGAPKVAEARLRMTIMTAGTLGLGVMTLFWGFVHGRTVHDELRPFAARIMSHTGPAPEIILFKLEERMWPFYLGMGCREIADLNDLPAQAKWVMVEAELRERRLGEMERRYGPARVIEPVQEFETDNAGGDGTHYLLLGFGDLGAGS